MALLDRSLCCEYIGRDAAFWQICQDALEAALTLDGFAAGLAELETVLLQNHDWRAGGRQLQALARQALAAGQQAADLAPLAALASLLPEALAYSRSLGANETVLRATFGDVLRWVAWFERQNSRPGLSELYWAVLPYAGELFEIGSLQYQPVHSDLPVHGWAARGGGLLLLAAQGLPLDAEGRACAPIDSVGTTAYSQNGDELTGHLVDPVSGRIAPNATCLPHEGLRAVLAPGQAVLNLHIPAGADLTPASVDASLRAAKTFFEAQGYPAGVIVCHSWMLDPQLEAFLPASSRVLGLARRFARLSVPGGGTGARFVFGTDTPPAQLPPEAIRTSLQQTVFDYLQRGGKLYDFGGVMLL